MKTNKSLIGLLLICLTIFSCKQPVARMPITRMSGTFMKESIERNKKLIAGEEAKIDSIIRSNPNKKFIASKKGYWFSYEIKNDKDTLRPKKGDVAYFDYDVQDFKGNVIYSEIQTKPQIYRIDKQAIMMGLRHGIKQMHKNEKVVFLFPSHMAYGYHGDEKNIGSNEPLICTVTLNDFKPETKIIPKNNSKNE
jgi:gliding motility-associated peptidyl-prolyl isomerase